LALEVGHLCQTILVGGLLGDGPAVLVLGRALLEGDQALGVEQRRQGGVDLLAGGLGGVGLEERQHRPVVLGQQVDLALLQGREHDLPAAQVAPGGDVDAGLLEHGGVHLGQDELLGEVGRADGHARLLVGLRAPLEVVPAAAGGQDQRQAGGGRGPTKPDPSHGCSSFPLGAGTLSSQDYAAFSTLARTAAAAPRSARPLGTTRVWTRPSTSSVSNDSTATRMAPPTTSARSRWASPSIR